MTDMRVGMFLELATTTGAVCGALLAAVVAPAFLYVLLGVVLLGSAGSGEARHLLRQGTAGVGNAGSGPATTLSASRICPGLR